ncbi:MAG: STAS domain-containing protein [Rhodothermaceae bacterium]
MFLAEEKINDVLIEIVNLDRATLREAEEFKKILTKNIEQGERKIIVDLSACEFIDSSFLGALVHILKKVVKTNGDLKLVGFKPAVRSMFELTRMFRVFETHSNLNEAVESYNQ